ncbi:complement factor H like 5 [Cynoglossus semilaevis]|uniref:complement factor H like 5 n=1 Tax=Cynoglossus semilaevis TaxID=244447 RepID=UPI00049624DE|nr:complement factor H-related protein 2-like [Cynoglossus semilaevis]
MNLSLFPLFLQLLVFVDVCLSQTAPLGCEQPPGVDNAEIMGSLKASYAHGEVVKYICPEYYLLEGQNFKKCENSIWTGKVGCLTPCTVNRGAMNNHNIRFKYRRDDKLYSTHNDFIEFVCSKGRPSGNTGMRVQCNNGVIILPTCQ